MKLEIILKYYDYNVPNTNLVYDTLFTEAFIKKKFKIKKLAIESTIRYLGKEKSLETLYIQPLLAYSKEDNVVKHDGYKLDFYSESWLKDGINYNIFGKDSFMSLYQKYNIRILERGKPVIVRFPMKITKKDVKRIKDETINQICKCKI